jgi:enterochelin esterase family protein
LFQCFGQLLARPLTSLMRLRFTALLCLVALALGPLACDGDLAAHAQSIRAPQVSAGPVAAGPAGADPAVSSAGDGNVVIGPTYADAPAWALDANVPSGTVNHLTLSSADSAVYRGDDPSLTQPNAFDRDLWLYVPAGYRAGDAAPFMVVQDGGGYMALTRVLDNLIAAGKLPLMLAVLINPGPGDGRGSERGLEYDTVSAAYGTFIETEVLPLLARTYGVRFTDDPEGRATMGGSSGGAAAFTMAWFHPDKYHRVLTYSGTFVNQHPDANYPHSAWTYHEALIAQSPQLPLRVFLEVGENDNNLDATFGDGMHDWRVANSRMSAALAAKGYHQRFVYALNAGHVDGHVLAQTLPETLLWLWQGYTARAPRP